MSDISTDATSFPSPEYDIAFYRTQHHLEVDRALDFASDFEVTGWQNVEDVVDAEHIDAYKELCKTTIGISVRVIYLPRESNVSRAIVHKTDEGLVFRPTGSWIDIRGCNFKLDISMMDQDFNRLGLGFQGDRKPMFELGNSAATTTHLRIDGRSYHFDVGPNGCRFWDGQAEAGKGKSTAAPMETVQKFVDNILTPLEDDIKAQAYTWTGTPKQKTQIPERYAHGYYL